MTLMNILANIMCLRRQTNIDKYLYEIIDDYKHSESDEEKSDIFKSFCSSIWSSENKRRVYTKKIRFSVRKDLLHTDIGQVFDIWSEVEYTGYKAMTKESDWCSLIRQKVNNLYTRYFDKDVILKKDYINLLNTPKRLYYQWIDGVEMDADELTTIIDDAIDDAQKLKVTYQKQKMELSWSEYKKVIEGFFQRCFDNCKLIEDYEKDSNYCGIYDFMNEDNFYIKYSNGILICVKRVSFSNLPISSTWGNLYEYNGSVSLGNWPYTFAFTPATSVTIQSQSGLLLEGHQNFSSSSAGTVWMSRPTTSTGVSGYISVIGIGKWKTDTTGGTIHEPEK